MDGMLEFLGQMGFWDGIFPWERGEGLGWNSLEVFRARLEHWDSGMGFQIAPNPNPSVIPWERNLGFSMGDQLRAFLAPLPFIWVLFIFQVHWTDVLGLN